LGLKGSTNERGFFLAGNIECVKVLLELGAPLHPRSSEGDTPRDLALHYGHNHIAEVIDNYPVQPPKTLPRMWLHENLGRKVCNVLFAYLALEYKRVFTW